jgi:hypothetical protein
MLLHNLLSDLPDQSLPIGWWDWCVLGDFLTKTAKSNQLQLRRDVMPLEIFGRFGILLLGMNRLIHEQRSPEISATLDSYPLMKTLNYRPILLLCGLSQDVADLLV